MSRCFPFPPPGYEKKVTKDHIELVTKEKHKEKKHKNDKDKEKEEHKRRKVKDRSKEKHDKNKDRKEKDKDKYKKNRDKNKREEKDRSTDKTRTSNEKIIECHRNHIKDRFGENSRYIEAIKNSKIAESLGRTTQDEENCIRQQIFQNVVGKVQNAVGNVIRKFDSMGSMAEKGRETALEKVHSVTVGEKKVLGMHSMQEMDVTSNGVVDNFISTKQRSSDSMGVLLDKESKKSREGNRKTIDQTAVDRKGDILKDKDRDKSNKKRDRSKNKEKKKEKDKTREKSEHKHREQKHVGDALKKDQADILNSKPLFSIKDQEKVVDFDGSFKRKKPDSGFFHEKDIRPNKSPRADSPLLLPVKNGRKLDFSLVTTPRAPDLDGAVNNTMVERSSVTEDNTNGMRESQPPPVSCSHSLVDDSCTNMVSTRPPHPDEQYLSQIYSVPETEELPEFDDQEWLLGQDVLRQKPCSKFKADEMPQVWAKVLRSEEADILALPYVIPY